MKSFATLSLVLLIALTGCKSHGKKGDEKKPATKPEKAALKEENSDVDFQAFVGRLRKAVRTRDLNTLATMMSQNFGYSLEPEKSGPGVFQYWDENNIWPELEGIIGERFAKKGEFWVAPPQFADESLEYTGYRVGIQRVNGSWKFVYFVNG
ncbi:MAG: hypothetical protein M3Z64_12085 [Verrucomicrobiota bacterium]|nr:hypothetical protein [Verrucomicrobiota bacterium]